MSKHAEQWNHNSHFHSYLLHHLPQNIQSALDVGCGLGIFAQKLAQRAVSVDAVDVDSAVIAEAKRQNNAPNIRYTRSDFSELDTHIESYDAITAIASIHHMDMMKTPQKMSKILRPSGTLVILGLYQEKTIIDHIYSWVSVPLNYAYLIRHNVSMSNPVVTAPTRCAQLSLKQIKEIADDVIPGYSIKRHLFWRYSLVWHKS